MVNRPHHSVFTSGCRFSSRTLRFLQENPWLTCTQRLWLLQTWSTCSVIPLGVDFVTDNPRPPSPSLPVTMTTKATLSVSYKVYTLEGSQPAFSLTYMAAPALLLSLERGFYVLSHAHVFSHHLLPTQKTAPDTTRVFCSCVPNNLATGAGGAKWSMRTLLLVFEVHREKIATASPFVPSVLALCRSRRW